jgi:hypothetical protein
MHNAALPLPEAAVCSPPPGHRCRGKSGFLLKSLGALLPMDPDQDFQQF